MLIMEHPYNVSPMVDVWLTMTEFVKAPLLHEPANGFRHADLQMVGVHGGH